MSILLQQKNVGDYSYMSSPNIYYRALVFYTLGDALVIYLLSYFLFSL